MGGLKVIVTGGARFIGSYLGRLLKDWHNINTLIELLGCWEK